MPNGERVWPDLSWAPGERPGEYTAKCQYGVYERLRIDKLTGVGPDVTGEAYRYEAKFTCACCGQVTGLGSGMLSRASYRACVDHYHRVCERAVFLAEMAAKN